MVSGVVPHVLQWCALTGTRLLADANFFSVFIGVLDDKWSPPCVRCAVCVVGGECWVADTFLLLVVFSSFRSTDRSTNQPCLDNNQKDNNRTTASGCRSRTSPTRASQNRARQWFSSASPRSLLLLLLWSLDPTMSETHSSALLWIVLATLMLVLYSNRPPHTRRRARTTSIGLVAWRCSRDFNSTPSLFLRCARAELQCLTCCASCANRVSCSMPTRR